MKKIVKMMILIFVCMLTMVNYVHAENYNPHTITIKSESFGHTYEAYQIFKGDLSDGKLTNVEWGLSIVDGDALLAELKTLDAYLNCEDARDVARVLAELNTAKASDEFAEIVSKYMNDIPVGSINGGVPHDDGYYYYAISVSGDGYYLIKDRDNSISGNDAYTKYILEVVNDVSVIVKSDYPTLEKSIDGEVYNNVSVGESVNFELSSYVPNMDGYNKYYFIIDDILSDGFTFNDDIKVMLGESELTEDEDYVVSIDGQNIEIKFIDFIQYQDEFVGEEIIVTYSAILDEDAICGVSGNSNSATLTYSNNPNYTYNGDNEPLSNEVVGVTPSSKTYTYVNELVITKIDGNNNELLSGAKFKITGDNLVKVEVKKDVYSEDSNGEYYLLNDGSYTKSIPSESTKSLYASTTVKYALSYETYYVDTREDVEAIGVVDESGTLTFKGLSEGSYQISEVEAPNGYNKLENPIDVVISWSKPTSGSDCVWSINGDSSIKGITVKNYAGITLPSTGGSGTFVYYLVGASLVGSAMLIVIKSFKDLNK